MLLDKNNNPRATGSGIDKESPDRLTLDAEDTRSGWLVLLEGRNKAAHAQSRTKSNKSKQPTLNKSSANPTNVMLRDSAEEPEAVQSRTKVSKSSMMRLKSNIMKSRCPKL